jgi:hypothetical protein
LAAVTTTVALAALPCLAGLVVGLLLLVIGVVLTLTLPFGADPPIFGLLFGLATIVLSVVGTIVVILSAIALALLFSVGILTPVALVVRYAVGRTGSKSPVLPAAALLVAGLFIGLGIGALVHLLGPWARWEFARSTWWTVGFYVLGTSIGGLAAGVYGSVLVSADAARMGGSLVLRRLFEKRDGSIAEA